VTNHTLHETAGHPPAHRNTALHIAEALVVPLALVLVVAYHIAVSVLRAFGRRGEY
jgi:hypothetical protein